MIGAEPPRPGCNRGWGLRLKAASVMWDRGRCPGFKAGSETATGAGVVGARPRLGSWAGVLGSVWIPDAGLSPGLGFKAGAECLGFGSQSRGPGIEAVVEWPRPWCRIAAVVLSSKTGAGCWAGSGSWIRTWGGTAWAGMKGAPQALLLEVGSPREQKPSSALPTAPSCGVWDPAGPRGERPRGGSPGLQQSPLLGAGPAPYRASRLPWFPAPRASRMNGRRVRPPRQDGDARLCQLGPRQPTPPGLKTKAGPGGRGRGPRFAWTPLCGEGTSCPESSPGGLAFPCLHSLGFPWGTVAWLLTF